MAIPATKRRYNVTLDAALAARLDAVAALRHKHRSTIIHWAVEDWLRRYEPGIQAGLAGARRPPWRPRLRLPRLTSPIPGPIRARSTWRTPSPATTASPADEPHHLMETGCAEGLGLTGRVKRSR